mmetsp:Transcript_12376/g.34763  ORF Transcript_12376/g.34763 Transcript_12376/m.34763 type:complete len:525 (-) Transcript_12376:143-1717(-)|eukprot:CAMPEP_0117679800 /NCGR_PEP_ID=MMETSP0804-20121206/18003_1 /TAXON_ID=1074897 /ORGANISM="Tetraselmis astigmatica, Strain CCMP880" /LENGTH=524 /DNA_ID=CAMNT_0005489237 /DNA_START=156 /DNA_END=1730 /DNA_ORIENTATION=-
MDSRKALVMFGLLCACALQVASEPTATSSGAGDGDWKRLELLFVALPLSHMHSPAAVAQEMCLRGHNVTLASLGEEGEKKARKYTPLCPVNYVSLGPSPHSNKDIERFYVEKMSVTNNTLTQLSHAKALFSEFNGIMEGPLDKLLSDRVISPDYAVISIPLGAIPAVLNKHGVDFAINLPTNLMHPLSSEAAMWVPNVLRPASIYSPRFLDRAITMGLNSILYYGKHLASALNLIPEALSDLNPATSSGRLVLVNAVIGIDYPQPLPPLVQYTGPVIDLEKMEPFPSEVEAWLDAIPAGKPVVYISYGTITVLGDDLVRYMLNSLSGDDIYVLWALPKSQQGAVPDPMPPNIMVHHWIPTPRALSHPKVKAFLSHCGGNSVAESMALGKPIVGNPQFAEQAVNGIRIADAGAGTTTAPRVWVGKEQIMEVLQDPKYSEKARSVSQLFRTFGGVGKAADLLEAGATGGLRMLASPRDSSFQAWYKLGGYDIIFAAALSTQLSLFLAYIGLCACVKRRSSRKVKTL